MTVTRRTLVLRGHYAGKTVKLGGQQFRSGRLELVGPVEDVENLTRYLGRCYQAEVEEPDGQHDIPPAAQPGAPAAVHGGIRPDGGQAPTPGAAARPGPAGTAPSGDPGLLPPRDGQEDTGIRRLREAVSRLDSKNDTHWTSEGLPAVSAVEEKLGAGNVTRKDINAAAPGWNRERAALSKAGG